MFDHARYTDNEKFLKEVCAPWLRESTLFYLSYLKQGEDGLWHMTPSNAAETWWKVKDPMTDMCGVRYCFEQVIKHGAEFGYEPDLMAMVQDRLEKLAPLPLGRWKQRIYKDQEIDLIRQKYPDLKLRPNERQVTAFEGIEKTDEVYCIAADIGEVPISHNLENPELYTVFPYARVVIDSPVADLQRGIQTFKERKCVNSYGWSPDGVQAARSRPRGDTGGYFGPRSEKANLSLRGLAKCRWHVAGSGKQRNHRHAPARHRRCQSDRHPRNASSEPRPRHRGSALGWWPDSIVASDSQGLVGQFQAARAGRIRCHLPIHYRPCGQRVDRVPAREDSASGESFYRMQNRCGWSR
jgi:hypothetical protein